MLVRRAGRGDLARLASLLDEIELAEGNAAVAPAAAGLRRSLEAHDWLASQSTFVLVAEVRDRLAGYAVAVRIPKLDARRGFLFVDELQVVRAERRRGIATALLDAVWALALQLDYAGVRLLVRPENEAASRLYTRLGYAESAAGFRERTRSSS